MDLYSINAANPLAPWNDVEQEFVFRIAPEQFDDSEAGYQAAFLADDLDTSMGEGEAIKEARKLVAIYGNQ